MEDVERTIKNLLHQIPGYTGYEAQEQRRDADKRLRDHLAQQYRTERQSLQQVSEQVVARGRLELAEALQQIMQSLDFFARRLETAPRGYAGWFGQVHIDAADLDQIYHFDAQLAESVPLLREQIGYVADQVRTAEQPEEALHTLQQFVDDLHTRLNARQEFLALGKRPDDMPSHNA